MNELRNVLFSPPDITSEEIEEVVATLKSGWITTGPRTKDLEKRIASYVGVEKSVCLNSATAAMELSLRLLEIGPGDEVITSAYTYSASAAVIHHVGAKIVLVDTAPGSFEMDLSQLASAINERTKAIIPVDIAGVICDYEKIYEIVLAKKHLFKPSNKKQEAINRITIIADAAHSFGASRNEIKSGLLADITCFSFHAVKNLTTAEGGAITWTHTFGMSNEEIYKEYMLLSLHGQSKDALSKMKKGSWEYDIIYPGYKCNMTDILAAVGLIQLKRYESLLERRFELIELYEKSLNKNLMSTLAHSSSTFRSSGHLFLVNIKNFNLEQRNHLIQKMADLGIATNVHYKPLPMFTAYKKLGFNIENFPNAYNQYLSEITLPLHTLLSNDDVVYVANSINKCVSEIIGWSEAFDVDLVKEVKISKITLITKRLFDLISSSIGIILLLPFLIVISIIIKITSKGPVIYKQVRVGRNGKNFRIYKFRTMIVGADKSNQLITVGNDSRVTKFGKILRKFKLDEFPQLFNVLLGTMSIVGPRPEVPKYVDMYSENQKKVLLLKPGITDYASIEYRDESNILSKSSTPEVTYINEIMPRKIQLNMIYANKVSLFEDIKIIFMTIIKIFK